MLFYQEAVDLLMYINNNVYPLALIQPLRWNIATELHTRFTCVEPTALFGWADNTRMVK